MFQKCQAHALDNPPRHALWPSIHLGPLDPTQALLFNQIPSAGLKLADHIRWYCPVEHDSHADIYAAGLIREHDPKEIYLDEVKLASETHAHAANALGHPRRQSLEPVGGAAGALIDRRDDCDDNVSLPNEVVSLESK